MCINKTSQVNLNIVKSYSISLRKNNILPFFKKHDESLINGGFVMKKQKSHDTKRLNLSKTQQVLYQKEFKQAEKVYERTKE
jgi:hypothetical protein